jgi:hypothetical protein
MMNMNDRIGPPLDWNAGCGYNSGIPGQRFDPKLLCGNQVVVTHFMFEAIDEDGYHTGALACDEHKSFIPMNQVLRYHSVGFFCQDPQSVWNYEHNECVMPLDIFEQRLLGTNDFGKDIDEEFATNPEKFRGELAP